METNCAVCDKDIEITIEEYMEDNEYICNDCAAAILEWCYELKLREN